VQRPGAAEGQQREAPRVDAALDGHHRAGADHLGVGHAHDALGALARLEARARPPAARRPRAPRGVELDVAGQRHVGAQVAEDEVGVGHRSARCRRGP
jgi:hypothetical protein